MKKIKFKINSRGLLYYSTIVNGKILLKKAFPGEIISLTTNEVELNSRKFGAAFNKYFENLTKDKQITPEKLAKFSFLIFRNSVKNLSKEKKLEIYKNLLETIDVSQKEEKLRFLKKELFIEHINTPVTVDENI